MFTINNSKRHSVFDFIVCAILSGIYAYIAWISKIEINLIFMIRLVLVFWLSFVLIRGNRLLQYMASVDVDLTEHLNLNFNSIEIPYKYKFKEWKKYLKKPFKRSLPIAIVLLFVRAMQILIYIPINIYLDVYLLLLFVYATVFGLSTTVVVGEFVTDFHVKHKLKADVSYGKIEIMNNVKAGMIVGLLFGVCLVYFVNMPKFHYFLYFFAFIMLFSFSKILIDLYRLFSNAVYSVLGYKFEEIPLTRRSR